jgi:hypothetical protein
MERPPGREAGAEHRVGGAGRRDAADRIAVAAAGPASCHAPTISGVPPSKRTTAPWPPSTRRVACRAANGNSSPCGRPAAIAVAISRSRVCSVARRAAPRATAQLLLRAAARRDVDLDAVCHARPVGPAARPGAVEQPALAPRAVHDPVLLLDRVAAREDLVPVLHECVVVGVDRGHEQLGRRGPGRARTAEHGEPAAVRLEPSEGAVGRHLDGVDDVVDRPEHLRQPLLRILERRCRALGVRDVEDDHVEHDVLAVGALPAPGLGPYPPLGAVVVANPVRGLRGVAVPELGDAGAEGRPVVGMDVIEPDRKAGRPAAVDGR